jgi:hypothetical protein
MIAGGNGSKRARQRAVVGVACGLAVLLMSLWKSGQVYDPLRHNRPRNDLSPGASAPADQALFRVNRLAGHGNTVGRGYRSG